MSLRIISRTYAHFLPCNNRFFFHISENRDLQISIFSGAYLTPKTSKSSFKNCFPFEDNTQEIVFPKGRNTIQKNGLQRMFFTPSGVSNVKISKSSIFGILLVHSRRILRLMTLNVHNMLIIHKYKHLNTFTDNSTHLRPFFAVK